MTEYKVKVFGGWTEWYSLEGKLHKLDGPALEYSNGYKSWWVNGKRHRLDGPAIEWGNGDRYWYIDGIQYSQEEFNQKIKEINNSCNGKIVEVDGKKCELGRITDRVDDFESSLNDPNARILVFQVSKALLGKVS